MGIVRETGEVSGAGNRTALTVSRPNASPGTLMMKCSSQFRKGKSEMVVPRVRFAPCRKTGSPAERVRRSIP